MKNKILYIFYSVKYILLQKIDDLVRITEIFENNLEYNKAIKLLLKTIEARKLNDDDIYQMRFRLNYLYDISGKFDEAISGYESLLSFSELKEMKTDIIISNLIYMYNRKKDYQKAYRLITDYITITEICEENKYVYSNIGNTYLGLKIYDEAINYYEKDLKKKQVYDQRIYYNLGLCFYYQKKYKKSINAFNLAIAGVKTNLEKGEILYSIGIVYYDTNNHIESRSAFQESLSLGYTKAREGLEELSMKGK